MKLDEVSKELIKSFNFDDVFDPDLTDDEKVTYYEDLLEEARVQKKVEVEDKIALILEDLLSRGETNE